MLTHFLVASDADYREAVGRVSEMYKNWSHAKKIVHQNLTVTTTKGSDFYLAIIWIAYTE